jgi:Ethanolamine utilization protein EutJ (predicted chaperonin)
VHDGKTFGRAIAQALTGEHQIRLLRKESTITVTVCEVLEEGAGVAYALRRQHDFTNALLFDIGAGTTIVSAFNGLQMTYRDYAPDAVVEKQIDALAT